MLRTIALLFAAFAFASGADRPQANGVPKGAVEISPGVFRYADVAGKTWFYRSTPFGYVRTADEGTKGRADASAATPAAAPVETSSPFGKSKAVASPSAAAPDRADLVKATEDGDVVRFERKSPFGIYKWTRKKTELTAAEQDAFDRSRNATPAAGTK